MATRGVRRTVWGVAGVVVAALVAAAAFVVTSDPRRDIDLGAWVEPGDSWARTAMPNARWATDELCGGDLPCRQAVRSDTLTMYRFADRDDAIAVARRFAGEAYLSGWIVVRFEPGALTRAQRSEFAAALDCLHVGTTEDGVEC
ncbi:hypothetical protein SAMN05660642_03607 [Geodermatophilus siccatus]|uniref:Uncharacterized protein n=1 Tax=Geodermatophilus siccatus TaxID=1137991 RepID=A0A1G9X9Q7_9ACTN|nr:SPOR domain-containing protein [Geodermatophilus siccatus]SDM93063.1 hypothetical protein SAMN05660642_03607 [Geodermatophilus siccatus]